MYTKFTTRIIIFCLLISLAVFSHAQKGSKTQLAGKGISPAAIVVPAGKLTLSESLAVRDLENYLQKITGFKFPVVKEGEETGQRCCLYVGSAAVRKLGLDQASFQDEEWIVRTKDGNIYFTGGVYHGPEYAVYNFLEGILGIRWWNAYEESVPRKPELSVGNLNLKGKPYFTYRQQPGNGRVGSGDFLGRNRVHRLYHRTPAGPMAYYPEGYGSPFTGGHSLAYLIQKADLAAHPEWASLINGQRIPDSGGLCLTNKELRQTIIDRIKGIHMPETARLSALVSAPLLPRIYDLSQSDGASWCKCPDCSAIASAEQSQAGTVVDFVNHIAGVLGGEYAELVFTTLAYQDSRKPTKSMRPADNVIVRWCTEPVNMARPLTDPSNDQARNQFLAWTKLAKNLGVWIYASAFSYMEPYGGYGVAWDFPVPNEQNLAQDYRFYAKNGVVSVLQETMEYDLVGNDMQDMKVWITAKLMEDPFRDYQKLLLTFTDGFYGPAGRYIRDYRKALQKAEARKPSSIGMAASLPEFRYLDLKFLLEADSILSKAQKAVAKQPVYLSRVIRARNGVDRAVLFLWPGLVREWVLAGKKADAIPLDRDAAMARYKKMAEDRFVQCSDNLANKEDGLDVEPAKKILAKQMQFWENNHYIEARLPAKLSGISKELIYDYPAGNASFRISENGSAQMIKDPDAVGGWAVKVALKDAKLPLVSGIKTPYGEGAPFKSVALNGTGYQLYNLGKTSLAGSSYLHFTDTNDVRVVFREIGACDIWASIKINGPESISIERVILVKPDERILGTLSLPEKWTVFTGFKRSDPVLSADLLKSIPSELTVDGRKITPIIVTAKDGKYDFGELTDGPAEGRTAYAFMKFSVPHDMEVTLGFGADWWLQAWVDGKPVCDTTKYGNGSWPPTSKDYRSVVKLTKGEHVLAIRHISGIGSSALAIAGPDLLKKL